MNAFQTKNNNRNKGATQSHLMSGLLAFAAALLLLAATPAAAHKLNMFAYAEGDEIFAESYFTDGKKAKNSEVTVFDSANNRLLQGTTDAEGQFSFAIPQQGDLRITVNAGMGHMAEYTILEDELSEVSTPALTPVLSPAAPPPTATANDTAAQVNDGPLTPVVGINLDKDVLRTEVERAVGKAIKPLMRELSTMRAEKSFADIVGGIGFIFGLLGVAMYFKARKQ